MLVSKTSREGPYLVRTDRRAPAVTPVVAIGALLGHRWTKRSAALARLRLRLVISEHCCGASQANAMALEDEVDRGDEKAAGPDRAADLLEDRAVEEVEVADQVVAMALEDEVVALEGRKPTSARGGPRLPRCTGRVGRSTSRCARRRAARSPRSTVRRSATRRRSGPASPTAASTSSRSCSR